MPIYSENETELENRLASLFAGAAATASLAASAASAVKSNPGVVLPSRLRAAVTAMIQFVGNVAAVDVSALLKEAAGGQPFPETLVARLAESSTDPATARPSSDRLDAVLADLRSLLEAPSSEAASRVEPFLRDLSLAENAHAHSLARGSLELEFRVGSPLNH